jgi:hypothetical protein
MRKAIVWNHFGKTPNTQYRNVSLVSEEQPTQEELKKVFAYNDATGKLHWKYRPKETFASPMAMQTFAKRFAGKVAQSHIDRGTPCVTLSGKTYRIRNLVWLYHHGYLPETRVRGVDGDKMNTRIENLSLE